MRHLTTLPSQEQPSAAQIVAERLTAGAGESICSEQETEALLQRLQLLASACIAELAEDHVASFIRSAHITDEMVRQLQLGSDRTVGATAHLLWEAYHVPPDAASWLFSLVSVVESMPVCVTISDAAVAGFPLVYVNQEFCRVTGYSKSEAQGRNCASCRAAHAARLGERPRGAARRGIVAQSSCATTSEPEFDNLLCLRAVKDSRAEFHSWWACS